MRTITADRIGEWKGRIIDVRSEHEFAGERLPRAECVPLAKLTDVTRGWRRDELLLLMCKSGVRSRQAFDEMTAAGFTQIVMLAGGLEACKKAGVDVVVVRKTIPIIRQVMITAGGLLLIGLLGGLYAPGFHVIDWIVACGLLFAGLTGYCPMARLLEMMPWNKTPSCCGTEGRQEG
ncbi:MAG: rhodanese-like domain-containing protein [Planctomycetes bacterium]|nr:rhodanese-like domain-containing protein [Planctomycetota bacterium]